MDKKQKSQSIILAGNLKRLRRLKGWNQNDLAEAADLSLGAVKQIETEQRWPRKDTIEELARALDVTSNELMTSKESAPQMQDLLTFIGRYPPELLDMWSQIPEEQQKRILNIMAIEAKKYSKK